MDNRPIGMFDSGIGGLTVLEEYKKLFPNENFIYYADTKHLPYGEKTKEQIIKYSSEIVEYFISHNVKAIVIACGTVSSLAYDSLVSRYNVPIFNIIDPVAKSLFETNIGIIATSGSIKSKVWENKIKAYNSNAITKGVACPKLVPIAEANKCDSEEAKLAIKEYMNEFKGINLDALVLGCTHYPLFSKLIQEELGNNVKLINVGTYSAKEFAEFLDKNNMHNDYAHVSEIKYIGI